MAGRQENHSSKGKSENPESYRIAELQACLLVIWLDATTGFGYLFSAQYGLHINASCQGWNVVGLWNFWG